LTTGEVELDGVLGGAEAQSLPGTRATQTETETETDAETIISTPTPAPVPSASAVKADKLKGWKRCRQPPCSRAVGCGVNGATEVDGVLCCGVVLEEILYAIDQFAAERGLMYQIGFGTLLGAYRDQHIIPWTADVDVIVEPGTLDVLTEISSWNPRYYAWIELANVARLCIVDYESAGTKEWDNASWAAVEAVYADIYVPRHNQVNGIPKTSFPGAVPRCMFNTEDMYGPSALTDKLNNASFTQLQIGRHTYPGPAKPEKLIEQTYGKNWRTPPDPSAVNAMHGNNWCLTQR